MKISARHKIKRFRGKVPAAAVRTALLLAACLIVRLLGGIDIGGEGTWFGAFARSDALAEIASISTAGRLPSQKACGDGAAGLFLLLSQSPFLAENYTLMQSSGGSSQELSAETPAPRATEGIKDPFSPESYSTPSPSPSPQNGGGLIYSESSENIEIKNKTDFEIDVDALMAEGLDIDLGDPSSPQVLIVHTHGSECYTREEGQDYEESDPYRTEDPEYSVISVGDALAETFESRGIAVIHDTGIYDYPSYNGSYSRSMEAIDSYMAQYPDIKIVIDLHRDALEDEAGNVYKTYAEIDGKPSAQVMLIVGTDYMGLEHPYWHENLKFALYLQATMNDKYPTLARPLYISQYRYNQNATTGSIILEVGCNGNTLTEAKTAVSYFGQAAADLLLS